MPAPASVARPSSRRSTSSVSPGPCEVVGGRRADDAATHHYRVVFVHIPSVRGRRLSVWVPAAAAGFRPTERPRSPGRSTFAGDTPIGSQRDITTMVDDGVCGRSPAVRVAADARNESRCDELLAAARDPETGVAVAGVGSTGFTTLEPLVLATLDGETAFFANCSILTGFDVGRDLDDGRSRADDATAVVEHDPETASLPLPDDGPLGSAKRTVLSASRLGGPESAADYRARRPPRTDTTAEDVMGPDVRSRRGPRGSWARRRRHRYAGRRGRGRRSPRRGGDAAVVVNANEAGPRRRGGPPPARGVPFSVLDPAFAAATRGGRHRPRGLRERERGRSPPDERGAAAARARPGPSMGVSVRIVTGPDEYKAGEPTVALEAIEGNHRPRSPAHPARPQRVRRSTAAHAGPHPADVRPGRPRARRRRPRRSRSRTRDPPVTVAGEVPIPRRRSNFRPTTRLDSATARGRSGSGRAACVGGVVRRGDAHRSTYPRARPGLTGARLGTNGVVELLDESTCLVAFAGERARFAKEENCGRCVPGREGSKQLVTPPRDVYDGEYKDGMLRELSRAMRETSTLRTRA